MSADGGAAAAVGAPLFDLACGRCGAAYPAIGLPSACPRCGGSWRHGPSLAWAPPDERAGPPGAPARWAALFGLGAGELPDRPAAPAPARLGPVVIAPQGARPGGSYKERGAELVAAACVRRGIGEVFLDSSGNAGIATARAAARRGIACRVLVPEGTTATKLERLAAAGAGVEIVPGDRAAARDAAERLRAAGGPVYASHVWQPAFLAGVATLAWDLDAAGVVPERILVPVGNGSLLLGLAFGFSLVVAAGRRAAPPALHAVQLAGFASLAPTPGPAPVSEVPVASGIAIARPPRRDEMAAAVAASGGDVTVVTDEEIARARTELEAAGHSTDPTGAAAWAALGRRPGLARPGTVVVLTSRE